MKINKPNKIIILLILSVFAINWYCMAADKALIIGLNEYQQKKYNLKGIDLDVSMAQKIAQLLSFESKNTKVLTGNSATKAGIQEAFANWLKNDVNEKDRVFVYFSGHGGHLKDVNSDEADGYDEYLTAYDLGNKPSEGGYILDDELSKWLQAIPSMHKIIMIDSCHSGTVTRSIIPAGKKMGKNVLYSKNHSFGQATQLNLLSKNTKSHENSGFLDGPQNTITLAAAHDFESAQASDNGSLFTIGLYQALTKAGQDGTKVTTIDLVDQAGQYIANMLADDPDYIHQPVVFGDKSLAQLPLTTKKSRNSEGPNWTEFKQIAASGIPMNASINQEEFSEGDLITFTVDLPSQGYLNVVNIDAHDVVTILFPNKFNPENAIKAGNLAIPGTIMPFEIEAVKPKGDSLTVFALTTQPLNLYQQSMNVRNAQGEYTETFAGIEEHSYRSMKVRAKKQKDALYTAAIKSTVK